MATRLQWLTNPGVTLEFQEVEGVVDEREVLRGAMLQRLERGPALLIDRHELAVQGHLFRRQMSHRRRDAGIVASEVFLIPRDQSDTNAILDGQHTIAIPFD